MSPSLLKPLDCDGHPGSVDAQHECKKFVNERKLLLADAVLCHQQPTGQSRFQVGAPVGKGGVRGLDHESLRITEKQLTRLRLLLHERAKTRSRQCDDPSPATCI